MALVVAGQAPDGGDMEERRVAGRVIVPDRARSFWVSASMQGQQRAMIAGGLAVVLLMVGCASDGGVTGTSLPPDPSSTPTSVPGTSAKPPTTSGVTTPPDPSTTVATVGTDPVSPAEPTEASRFQLSTVTVEPFVLSPDALDLFDGLLLSVPVDVVFEGGGRGWATAAVRVVDGEAWIVMGRFCGWEYLPALDAIDGSVLFDSGIVCTPGERYATVPFWRALATARVDDRRLVLVAGEEGLRHLDLDSREFEPVVDVDWEVERPASASFGSGQWVVVMAECCAEELDARGRVVFVDPNGSMIVHENNPFPEFGDEVGPRAAVLDPDGTTLIVAVEDGGRAAHLVFWDLETGVELSRQRIIDPVILGDDPRNVAREFVSSIDLSEGRVLVNVTVAAGEYLPARALLVDPEGNVVDLSEQQEITIVGADFLEH